MKLEKSSFKLVAYLFWSILLGNSLFLVAYEPPSSPELHDSKEKYKNVMPKNKSGMILDITGGVGLSTAFQTSAAFSYTGALGFGYRYAITTWNVWDFVFELDFGLGGDGAREVGYPIGVLMRFDYGTPINEGVNLFFQFGAGAAWAKPLKQDGKFSPQGLLGLQFEFAATKVFRVLVGPRISFKTAPAPTGNGLTIFYAPELLVGLRFPF